MLWCQQLEHFREQAGGIQVNAFTHIRIVDKKALSPICTIVWSNIV